MPQHQRDLLARFDRAMLDIYDAAKRLKPPYNPSDFRRMVTDLGGKETADRLLASRNPSSGFTELFLRGKENLKLSVEYLVLQDPWRSLFSPEQLEVARHRLREVDCELPPEDSAKVQADWSFPEELSEGQQFIEGAGRQVVVNAYERSSAARMRCIAHYGATCVICGFDFGRVYGRIAEGYIHVHHIVPLSAIRGRYEVDPIADLRPVCANCHSVIHLGGETRSIDEVKALVETNARRAERY